MPEMTVNEANRSLGSSKLITAMATTMFEPFEADPFEADPFEADPFDPFSDEKVDFGDNPDVSGKMERRFSAASSSSDDSSINEQSLGTPLHLFMKKEKKKHIQQQAVRNVPVVPQSICDGGDDFGGEDDFHVNSDCKSNGSASMIDSFTNSFHLVGDKHTVSTFEESGSFQGSSIMDFEDSYCCKEDDDENLELLPLVERGKWKTLKNLTDRIEENYDPAQIRKALATQNRLSETPIHVAAWKAPAKVTVALLDVIKSVEDDPSELLIQTDHDGNTPLHLACANLAKGASDRHFQVLRKIHELAPIALTAVNLAGDTPMHLLVASEAFSSNHTQERTADYAAELVKTWLPTVPDVAVQQNNNGLAILHIAIANKTFVRILKFLVSDYPASCSLPDTRQQVPLHYAASFYSPRIHWKWMQALLEAAPEARLQKSVAGETPEDLFKKHYATKKEDKNTRNVKELLSTGKVLSASMCSSGGSVASSRKSRDRK